MNNQVRTLRNADREFRSKFVKSFSESIKGNVPSRYDSSVVSRNIARWHVDQQDSGMIRFCRKHGVKDAVEILWTDDSGSAGVVLTEKNKLLVFDGEKFEEF